MSLESAHQSFEYIDFNAGGTAAAAAGDADDEVCS